MALFITKELSSSYAFLELRVSSNSNEVFVISCYAPTFGAGREEKDSFYGLLQGVSPKYHPRSAMCYWGTSMFV